MPVGMLWVVILALIGLAAGYGLFKGKLMKTFIAVGIFLVAAFFITGMIAAFGLGAPQEFLNRFNLLTLTTAAAGGYFLGWIVSWFV